MNTHMAINQYGETFHDLGKFPRKELLSRIGKSHADKMYIDTSDGSKHIGWIIDGQWLSVYKVEAL